MLVGRDRRPGRRPGRRLRRQALSRRHPRPGDCPATATPATGQRSTTLPAAGDTASCASGGDEQTAALFDTLPGTVLTLGDTAYDDGSADQFARCYLPSWGRFRDRTYPAPDNHDYQTAGASGYYGFFGPRAGQPGKGWYSFNLGRWHLIALNSNCDEVGGCQPGSEQERWLRTDLAAHPARCTLAFWHHPRFSSGTTMAATRRSVACGRRCTRPAPTLCYWDTSTTTSASPRSTLSVGRPGQGGAGVHRRRRRPQPLPVRLAASRQRGAQQRQLRPLELQ
jgi:hypothetical protein